MRDHYLLAFVLALPALGVLGHDVYLAYNNTLLPLEERFYLSDVGWLWKEYSPDTYQWALDNTDPVMWTAFIDPVLQGSAFYVFGAPFAIFVVVMLFMKIFGLGPFEGHGMHVPMGASSRKGKGFAFGGGGKGRTKYKRK